LCQSDFDDFVDNIGSESIEKDTNIKHKEEEFA
jgi:hypothetical protein